MQAVKTGELLCLEKTNQANGNVKSQTLCNPNVVLPAILEMKRYLKSVVSVPDAILLLVFIPFEWLTRQDLCVLKYMLCFCFEPEGCLLHL